MLLGESHVPVCRSGSEPSGVCQFEFNYLSREIVLILKKKRKLNLILKTKANLNCGYKLYVTNLFGWCDYNVYVYFLYGG